MSENNFETIEQRVSYGVGRQLGDQLRNNPFKEFDTAAVQAGVECFTGKGVGFTQVWVSPLHSENSKQGMEWGK